MRAMLVQQGVVEELQGLSAQPADMPKKNKAIIMDKAHSVIILSIGDKGLREVSRKKIA